ncbi:hypothetical protein [Pseudomonas petrae]|uniref:hypothetical protein n=1 Tax=Pseudomonas petrae TaxID=2912190 RepID=UPI001F26DEF2|nr:hypothetical protein [Pseudomonas petrae]MCF7536177.1 hypothetical protein [Pseudomonas petrae]
MSDLGLSLVILAVWLMGAHLGYWLGRLREQKRLIPAILEERNRANRLSLELKFRGERP